MPCVNSRLSVSLRKVSEINDIRRIIGLRALLQLPTIPRSHQQVHRTPEGLDTFGKATRLPMQTRQIVPQLGMVAFDRIGLGFVQKCRIRCSRIIPIGLGRKALPVILRRRNPLLPPTLPKLKGAWHVHRPPHTAAGRSSYSGHHLDAVFC